MVGSKAPWVSEANLRDRVVSARRSGLAVQGVGAVVASRLISELGS